MLRLLHAQAPKDSEPVTVAEVEQAVLKAIAETFGNRPLDSGAPRAATQS
jgi:hypothetical protein